MEAEPIDVFSFQLANGAAAAAAAAAAAGAAAAAAAVGKWGAG